MTASNFTITANVVDIPNHRTFAARVEVQNGRIASIAPSEESPSNYLLPGFIDAHVHIESSMLVPSEFARAAIVHGTVATVSDPHEIGNVLGVAGVQYMLENAAQVPFKFNFGAPSCVPATNFETAGAEITVAEVQKLLDDPRIRYLSEMMNFPGILHGDPGCLAKVKAAHNRGKPVDGHAPGLRGEQATRYIAAELGPKGIRVHAISPGPLKTRAASGIAAFDELLERAARRAPTHDLVTIDDVGAVAACLVSDAARAMTGNTAYVDGGYHIVA